MIINSLYLKNFGKFKEKKIELKPGINVIYGANEAGKSTIHSFIRGMLFGMEKQRGRSNYDNYTKYRPIDTPTIFYGEMEYTTGEGEFVVKRNFYKEEKSCQVVNRRTGRELDIARLKGNSIIEGVTENNYCNTAYIAQRQVIPGKDLANRIRDYITNMTMTKSSEVNITNAMNELQKRKKEIELKKTGQQLSEINEELQKIQATDFMLKELERQILLIEDKKVKLRKEKNGCKIEKSLLEKISVLQTFLDEYNIIQEKYHTLNDCILYERTLREQISTLDKICQTEQPETDQSRKKSPLFRRLCCGIVGMIVCICSIYYRQYLYIIPGVLIFCGIFVLKHKDDKAKHNTATKQVRDGKNLKGVLGQYETMIADLAEKKSRIKQEIIQYANKIMTMREISEQSMAVLEQEVRGLAEQIRGQQQEIEKRQSRSIDIDKELEGLDIREEKFRWEYTKLEESIRDYSEKRSLRDDLSRQVKKEKIEIEAIEISIETIKQLAANIHDDFGQRFNQILTEYASKITGNRTTDIKTDEKLNIKVVEDTDYINLEYLSIGTIEQIYLALRMVASELLLQSEYMPVILDDAFAYYDEYRLEQTCKWLTTLTNRQVIIFTCQAREKEVYDQLGVPYQYIEI